MESSGTVAVASVLTHCTVARGFVALKKASVDCLKPSEREPVYST